MIDAGIVWYVEELTTNIECGVSTKQFNKRVKRYR